MPNILADEVEILPPQILCQCLLQLPAFPPAYSQEQSKLPRRLLPHRNTVPSKHVISLPTARALAQTIFPSHIQTSFHRVQSILRARPFQYSCCIWSFLLP